jgi:hypothetical protein
VLAFCVSATVGFLADAAESGIRSTLASVPASDASVTLRAPLAHDASAQDAGVRAVIATVFEGAPLKVARTVSAGGSDVVRWTIAPVAQRTTVADLARLRHGDAGIEAAVTKSRAARSPGVGLSGHGATTITTLVRAVGAQQTIEPIPITALVLAGIVALLLARSLLTDSRQNETRLLRSRGASGRTVTALDARESLVVCAIGTIAGSSVAQAGLLYLFGIVPALPELVIPPVAVFVIAFAITLTVAGLAARSASGAPRSESGRRRAAAPLTITGFGVLVVVIALWRFEQSGTDGASFDSDPSAALAPGALLCAAVLLCLLLAGQLTGRIEAVLRHRATVAVFPVRSVNRHIAIIVGPTALLAIALAIATVTGAYGGTWQRFATDSQQLTTGGDLRATVDVDPLVNDAGDPVGLDDFAAIPGVDRAALAAWQSDTFGDIPVSLVAVAATQLPHLIRADSTVANPTQLADQLGSATTVGLALPAHASALTVTIEASGTTAHPSADSVQTTLWLGDARGELITANLRSVPLAATAGKSLTAPLPTSGGPWVIEAIDASVDATDAISQFRFRIAALSARTPSGVHSVGIPPSSKWTPRDGVFGDGTDTASGSGTIGFDRTTFVPSGAGSSGVRIMPSDTGRVAVVLSRSFATATGLVVGSKVSVAGQWASFDGIVTGIVAGVPGVASGDSMIASLPALDRGWLETSEQIPSADEVWMSSADPASAGRRIQAVMPSAQVRLAGAASGGDIVNSATTALWIGTIGASAFAVIALVAAVIALLRRRAVETRALRAMGLDARRQSSLRRRELWVVSTVALASGLVSGASVSALVTATMARLSTPDAPAALPLRLELDPVPLAVTAGLLVIALVFSGLGYGAAVGRQARGRP